MILFSSAGNRYISIIEVKTKETSDVLKVEDIDQIGGHRAQYQTKYPDRPVHPMIFTNKGEISREAVQKAKGNVRILRNIEFTTFMSRYIELMEKGWKIDDPAERLAFMEKMPSLDRFEVVFKPSTEPLVSLDDMNSII